MTTCRIDDPEEVSKLEAMAEYERFALILDSAEGALGHAAIRLIELGIDLLYTNDLDEAALLAAQESRRLGAVLIPSSFETGHVDPLIARVCSRLEAGPKALVVAGSTVPEALVAALRGWGASWCLQEPYELRDLRFVMTAAMATSDSGERRKHLRIPTQLSTTVFMGRHRKEVGIHDLSLTGAYFATPHPFLEDSALSIDLPLPGGSVLGKAVVVNAKTADKPGRADVPDGMGVAFTELPSPGEERLARYVEDWIGRFRL
jgi:hypothetical protein